MFGKHKCKHIWEEQDRVYNQPGNTVRQVSGISHEDLLQLQYGFTIIVSKCITCNVLDFKRVTGKV